MRHREPKIGAVYHGQRVTGEAGFGGRGGTTKLYTVECAEGHIHKLTKTSIRDRGCPACRKAENTNVIKSRTSSTAIEKRLAELEPEQAASVRKIMARHMTACEKLGIEFNQVEYERAWLEAIEMVLIEPDIAETIDDRSPDDLHPQTRYTQYSVGNDSRI